MEERIIKVILQNTCGWSGFGFHQDFNPHQNEERWCSLVV